MTLCQFVRRAEPFLDHGEPFFSGVWKTDVCYWYCLLVIVSVNPYVAQQKHGAPGGCRTFINNQHWSWMVRVAEVETWTWFTSPRGKVCIDPSLSMFVRYVWAFRTRVLKTRVPERAFWVNPFFQWYKVNLFPGFEQRNLFPPLKKRMWSSCGLKMVDAATRRLISDLGHDLDLDGICLDW